MKINTEESSLKTNKYTRNDLVLQNDCIAFLKYFGRESPMEHKRSRKMPLNVTHIWWKNQTDLNSNQNMEEFKTSLEKYPTDAIWIEIYLHNKFDLNSFIKTKPDFQTIQWLQKNEEVVIESVKKVVEKQPRCLRTIIEYTMNVIQMHRHSIFSPNNAVGCIDY